MSPAKSMPGSERASAYFSIPGKAFLLGEYGVLGGLPAAIATFGPRFGLKVQSGVQSEETALVRAGFHPESPAGRLLALLERERPLDVSLQFEDPYRGQGGFGGSTAQYALTYHALAGQCSLDPEWSGAWDLYRQLMADAPLAPSGADLVAQWRGGVCVFDPQGEYFKVADGQTTCADVWEAFDWSSLLVFSASGQAGRKVATHEHLARLSQLGVVSDDRAGDFPEMRGFFGGLQDPLLRGLEAVTSNRLEDLGRALSAYGDELARLGLELPQTAADREAFRGMSGVLGVKGAGAMQADAILVLVEPELQTSKRGPERQKVIELGLERGLQLVAEGLPQQAGVSSHH